ncbi:hypothetical protein [Chromobacterium vaccinii]|uniref:Uncharacterized protein n=1 Tax=Chromobacterium vaccinii TaxID=1108595 RepID=A0A1D9LE18_9NEIS|nr:hypothetical protein [Chromobacterium vaccinii]AOZ49513.1 hypothetical protein BKX93_05535 [Chromobacterium vaccinii]SUX54015.1 Uncharacterised protein [Chromobacterium vaccinii]
MKIASATVSLGSSVSQSQSLSVTQTLSVTSPQPSSADNVQLSSQATQASLLDQLSSDKDAVYSLIEAILEKAFGVHFKLLRLFPLRPENSQLSAIPDPAVSAQQDIDYQQQQQLSFTANGQITTQDGRQLQFSLNMQMQSSYQYHSSQSYQSGGKKSCDPLMVNLGGAAGSLDGASVSFDLQNNGQMVNLPFSSQGGWLALDKNGDGKINDGSELFGPQSGNGFADLAKLDSNHDGVIDESDPAFAQLKIWAGRGSDGKDQLSSLKDAGIGAILLPSVDAPLTMRANSSDADPQAQMRRAGVFVKEDGQAGMISQLDIYG